MPSTLSLINGETSNNYFMLSYLFVYLKVEWNNLDNEILCNYTKNLNTTLENCLNAENYPAFKESCQLNGKVISTPNKEKYFEKSPKNIIAKFNKINTFNQQIICTLLPEFTNKIKYDLIWSKIAQNHPAEQISKNSEVFECKIYFNNSLII